MQETPTRSVIVDADACPRGAMQTLVQLQAQYRYRLVTVASFHHVITHDDDTPHLREHVTVGDAKDEADLAIANRARPGDIVVTQDWALAALALGKGASALSPTGMIFEPSKLDFLLQERYVKAKFRRAGGRTKGPRARSKEDDERFRHQLIRLLESRA